MTTRRRTRTCQSRPIVMEGSAWSEAARGWAQHLAADGRSATTIAGYLKHVSWLGGDLAEVCDDPWEVTVEQLEVWLEDQHWSASTRVAVLVSLRGFYRWGILAGQCRRSPLAGMATTQRRPRGPRRLALPAAWVDPVMSWENWLRAAGRTEQTLETRLQWITRLAREFGDPWCLTSDDLAQWLSRPDWQPETKRSARSSVQGFYRWAELTGRVRTSPARALEAVRTPRALPRPAPDDAVREALAAADDRVRLALLIAMYAGLRRTEIAHLHARDLVGTDAVHVIGKGGHERLVPLHPDLARELRDELRRRREGVDVGTGWGLTVPQPDGWLFPSDDPSKPLTGRWLGTLMARALPPGYTAHSLRHRFATQAYRSQRDLRAVQELLGHTKPETTARYAAVPEGALAAAVAGVGLGAS